MKEPTPVVAAFEKLIAELKIWQQDPAWLALNNPVAYLAIRRAQRNGREIRRIDV